MFMCIVAAAQAFTTCLPKLPSVPTPPVKPNDNFGGLSDYTAIREGTWREIMLAKGALHGGSCDVVTNYNKDNNPGYNPSIGTIIRSE